ncbi:hypothetical protein CBP36_21340 (plasmid) [Acidovorax carolinensis]|uniref:P-type conjugative transfer protein TrbL n=1 Tax=Acidovorax carolinensis TaxID=553814 RepID=A0A240UKE2_9BURK|nr:type IV secretion system protein [Acidovorax carolinensis]ART61512.1 hypothetical protein CBP36_21340 [Acidovorax carolinensis]
MKTRHIFIAGILLVVAQGVFAQQTIDVNGVLDIVKQAIAPAIGKLVTQAITWLGVFAVLQFFMTNYKLLLGDGDISSVLGKLVGSLAWIGVCLYLIQNGAQFIQSVGDQLMSLLGMDLPSPASIVTKTVMVTATMGAAAIGISAIPLIGDTAGIFLVYITLGILGIGLLFAFKIFMLQLEIMLVALLAPLSFAFLGLNSLKDQGIAPFKALISFAYRVILLTVILSGFNQISDIVSNVISNIDKTEFAQRGAQQVVQVVLSALGAYLLLAYLAFKSDSIAATLASGSTSMGTGDVAQAAATGAALGAAVAAGGVTAAATGGKVPQSMSAFMDKMMGGSSVSNASPMGSGGGDAPTFTPPAPSMSTAAPKPATSSSSSSEINKPPARPQTAQDAAATNNPKNVVSGRYGGPMPNTSGNTTANAPANPVGDVASPTQGQGSAPGSALSAGIGDPKASNLERDLGKLVEHLSSQGPRKPTFREKLGDANRHVSQEQATTHVSVSSHHAD